MHPIIFSSMSGKYTYTSQVRTAYKYISPYGINKKICLKLTMIINLFIVIAIILQYILIIRPEKAFLKGFSVNLNIPILFEVYLKEEIIIGKKSIY